MLKTAILQPELRSALHVRLLVLKKCDFAARAAFVLRSCDLSSRSRGSALCVLALYVNFGAAECSSRTTVVLKKSDFPAGATGMLFPYTTLLPVEVATFEPELRECTLRATSVLKNCDCAARATAARFALCTGPQRELRLARSPQRVRRAPDTARALRHARSPQRLAELKTRSRRRSESASTRAISAEGLPSSRHIRTAPQRERFDAHDIRRGFAAV